MAEPVYYRFTTEGFPEDTFTVARFSGEEAISELYRFRIDLLSEEDDLDIDFLQDQPSTFLMGAGGHERVIQGIVTDVEILDQPNGTTIYRVAIRPRAWELARGSCHKVYLDTTAPDIIRQVLDQANIAETDYHLEVDESQYREWEFRLQYGESFWHFLSRILERDGIYYYFTAGEAVEQIHFCDSVDNQPDIEQPELHFSSGLGMESPEVGETVHSLVTRRASLLRDITLQNYNDAKPSTRINVTVDVDPEGTGSENLYGQKVQDEEEAKALAELRAEEMRARKIVHHGESTVCLLSPAHQFRLDNHPRASMNEQAYQVISVEHRGHDPWACRQIGEEPESGTPAYENRFTAIGADRQYRPPQKTEKPAIHGTLNARVDAEGDGQYAELDDEGRYHIIFPFDTTHPSGKASHWVRMMQPYAGEREGMHFPLRKGARVLISFLVGDPDLPVVNGAIPNAEQPSTTTADNQTMGTLQTAGGNCIEMDDNQGAEWMQLSSRRFRTKLRLGAGPDLNQGGDSIGAQDAHTTGDPDPDADGSLLESDYLFRTVFFRGENSLRATRSWAIDETIWDDSTVQRDNALHMKEDEDTDLHRDIGRLSDYDGEDWRIKHGINKVFRFPRKHNKGDNLSDEAADEPDSTEFVTAHEEASGHLHATRHLGDGYRYQSGSTFTFFGPDHEAYDFGPSAAFSAAAHDVPAESLRAKVLDSIESGNRVQISSAKQKKEDAQSDKEDAEQELEDRTERAKDLRQRAEELARDLNFVKASLAFSDAATLEEWLELENFRERGDQDKGLTRHTLDSLFPGITDIPGIDDTTVYFGIDESELESADDDEPRDGSIEKAKQDFEALEQHYKEKLSEYNDLSGGQAGPWSDHLRKARISVNMLNAAMWHEGNIYDFGGHRRYNFGGAYTESHVSGIPSLSDLDADDHDHDLLKECDAAGANCEWGGDLDSSVKGAMDSNGNVLAHKTIGDTYTYQKGTDVFVHVGSTQIIRDEDKRVEIDFAGDQKTREFTSTGGADITKRRDPNTGALVFYNADGYSTGHDSFTFELEYSNDMTIKLDATATSGINLGGKIALNLTGGLETEMNIGLAAKVSIALNAGTFTEVNVPILNKNDITLSPAAFTTEIKVTGFHYENKNGKGSMKLAGMDLEKGVMKMDKEASAIDKAAAYIGKKAFGLEKGVKVKK